MLLKPPSQYYPLHRVHNLPHAQPSSPSSNSHNFIYTVPSNWIFRKPSPNPSTVFPVNILQLTNLKTCALSHTLAVTANLARQFSRTTTLERLTTAVISTTTGTTSVTKPPTPPQLAYTNKITTPSCRPPFLEPTNPHPTELNPNAANSNVLFYDTTMSAQREHPSIYLSTQPNPTELICATLTPFVL
ncbi:hypothetical protein M758_4G042800 [Ceratodon purpureus]|nr:hypothetical protein M758_4G042800 [Ceratodon purpureus]